MMVKMLTIAIIAYILVSYGYLPPASASELSKAPILRIEAGMHTAPIKRISVDRSGRWLVSASLDKTVRVWDLSEAVDRKNMRPTRILRPPIGYGNEGQLNSVAISPDGELVATGGFTKIGSDSGCTIYLFSRSDGRLLGRFTELPNVIFHLAFSADGRYLAAGLGKNGVRVFSVSATGSKPRQGDDLLLRVVAQDTDYGNSIYGLDFSPDGSRLVTACFDGYVRSYDFRINSWGQRIDNIKALTPKTKFKAPGGEHPYSVKFSPDGEKIVVGFDDSSKVNVLSSRDLTLLYVPNTTDINVINGNLAFVAWSESGLTLYAAGRYSKLAGGTLLNPIRYWVEEGKGASQELMSGVLSNGIEIIPLPDGTISFGSQEPSIGILNQDAMIRLFVGSSIVNYSGILDEFRVSGDGTTIQFSYKPFGELPAAFSMMQRSLDSYKGLRVPGATTPDTTSLKIDGWRSTNEPKLNGHPLKLNEFEISRSLAISPDKESFLLGAEWFLRRIAKDGTEEGKIPAPSTVWGVNITRDGKIAVAAFGDGTIRWYNYLNGKELLALFPHADRKRWVLWTPTGYYDASPGGEELIGWHVNNGADKAADFFPVSRFRSSYYRPDIIDMVLKTLDEDEAVRQANEELSRRPVQGIGAILPPVVRIVSPENGETVASQKVSLKVAVRSPTGAKVSSLKLLIDGRPVPDADVTGLDITSQEETFKDLIVPIPGRDCEVSVVADGATGTSQAATIRILWNGELEAVTKPTLYLLAIGINEYSNGLKHLGYATKDAEDFVAAMKRQKGGIYKDVIVKVLKNEKANKNIILGELAWLEKETTSRDVVMIFFAGHGLNERGVYYFLPFEANPDKLKQTAMPYTEIENTVRNLYGKVLLFLDTCHSGNVMGGRGVGDIMALVNELSSVENGIVVFTASTGRQDAQENSKWKNGAFTKALVEGVNGEADKYTKSGKITIKSLDLFITERVKELTNGKQNPATQIPNTIADFPIAVVR